MPFERTPSDAEEIASLKERLSGFETEEGRLLGLSYTPKSCDEVIITTTPKAGTTWMQQICHQLRSGHKGGDMTFSEISEVVPWLELAYDQGQDLYGFQFGESEGLPRIFKTHAWEEHCPKGCKKIVVLRDPLDVVVSFYNFFEDWFFERGAVSLEGFAKEFWLARGKPQSRMSNASYFVHLISWWKRRRDDDVLFVFFEDLKEDLETEVRRVAKFISTQNHDFTADEIVQGAVERSSFVYMKQHSSQFDEKLSKIARNEACGLSRDAGMSGSKLKGGKSGYGTHELSDSLRGKIQDKWMEVVGPVTGCSTYIELRDAMRAEESWK